MKPRNVVALHRAESASVTGGLALTDEALVAGCGVGDTSALGALYDRHQANVTRFIARLTRGADGEVDDLVHETFLSAAAAAASFRGTSSVRTWLFGIAANHVRHATRAMGRRRALADAIATVVPEPSVEPDRGVRERELRESLASAIASLPHDLRVVFVLCDLEDVPCAEAARTLGIPEGTLFRRRHEARRALREALRGVR